ncbi:MAG: hypothetical protein IT372_02670 [Polyangiaceae bacterium]|nr:hypothetical protein [Polyangiaceae bacterium]
MSRPSVDPPADPADRGLEIAFRLPIDGWPRALFRSDFGFGRAALEIDGAQILRAGSRDLLERGVEGSLGAGDTPIAMQLVDRGGALAVRVLVAGQEALREDRLHVKPTRSAWIHAVIALLGSAAGFAASYFYLLKAEALHSEWALKMGQHTAGWHLLLTLTLFPASVWGQRLGIRAVQLVSLVFFLIHAGIALANSDLGDPAIALFNALSGVFFLAATVYGNRAHRDMDPIAALREGRA